MAEAPKPARTVVRVEVVADDSGDRLPPVHVAAGDRAGAAAVRVIEHGEREARLRARLRTVALPSFHDLPSVVHAGLARPNDVDFLARALAHNGDVQIPVRTVEAEAPRISQTPGPDLGTHVRGREEGIPGG